MLPNQAIRCILRLDAFSKIHIFSFQKLFMSNVENTDSLMQEFCLKYIP